MTVQKAGNIGQYLHTLTGIAKKKGREGDSHTKKALTLYSTETVQFLSRSLIGSSATSVEV